MVGVPSVTHIPIDIYSPGYIWAQGSTFFSLMHPVYIDIIYTTTGRDRFHWAASPLKPYKVGNICYMTYRYSMYMYFLNLSLKHFFSHRKRQLLWKYPNPETVIVPCFNVSRMPNRRTSQSKIEDVVHCKCISLLNKGRHIHPVRHAKHSKQILQTKHTFTTKLRGRPFDSAGLRGGGGAGI